MNLTIYNFPAPPKEMGENLDIQAIIPWVIKRPLCVHEGMLSFLIDLDDDNSADAPKQYINIVRGKSWNDFHNFCENPQKITQYHYMGVHDELHYFIGILET